MAYKDELLLKNDEESDEESEDDEISEFPSITIINEPKNPQVTDKTSFWFLKSEFVSLTFTLIIIVFAVSFVIYSVFFKNSGENINIVEPDTEFNYALRIDLNNAEIQMFELLPGIGPKIAQKIIDYRENSGGFKNVDELERIQGISLRMVNLLRPFVYVEQSENTAD